MRESGGTSGAATKFALNHLKKEDNVFKRGHAMKKDN